MRWASLPLVLAALLPALRAQTLEVAPGPGERPIPLSREAGEERLMDLCLLAANEDAWVHYELAGRGHWLDAGSEERPDEVRISVPWDRLSGIRELAIYHTHSAVADLVRAARRYRPMAHGDVSEYAAFILRGTPGLFARAPGRTDFEGAIELRRQAAARGVRLETRVVAALGVYSYGGEPEVDLARAWELLDFEGYIRPGGRERLFAAFAALGLELEYAERRSLEGSALYEGALLEALRAHSPAWNPP